MGNKQNDKQPKIPSELKKVKLRAKRWVAYGSLIIFVSWITQNFYQEKWHSEVVRIERNKLGIGFNEVNKNIYQTFLNAEQSKMEADSNYDGNIFLAFFAYDMYANLLQSLGVNLASDDAQFTKENDNIYKNNVSDLTKWYKAKDINKLQWFAQRLSQWESENGMNTIGAYQTKLAEIREKEEYWNTVYLILYILGASCFCYSFLLEYKVTNREN